MIGYVFIMPFILGFILWFLVPALVAANLTFQRWNLISPPTYVGTANIERLFTDPILPQSLKATFLFTILSVPIGLVFAFFLAMLINTPIRGIAVFRTIYFLPSIVPAVASAVLWAWLLNTEFGLVNYFIRELGGPKIPWLQDPGWAIPAFIILSTWGVGGSMIIFLAGLQGIPEVYYEAAKLDGAGRFRQLWNITLPLMSPIIFFNLVMGFINSFQVFVSALLITNGGPQNATLFLVLYIYRTAFQSQNMGYAATLSWVLFFILMILSLIIFRVAGSRVYYENAD
ncbi:sugar ABC transporter permease [Phototrophicus methaneseepsis]|uniref:Sugar ABC transporter permease n=1 Tax=Phototrophicus methaneseepsis TaxID=2710758 RepID=A0A7S8EDX4_9CHLR|nr:sugar ABC transporter permease [Phototrophicus methaneseepsis]